MSSSRAHVIFGDPEVLSCYSSSTERSGATQERQLAQDAAPRRRRLPKELQQYLSQSVAKGEASSASSASDAGPRKDPSASSLGFDDPTLRASAVQAAASSSYAPAGQQGKGDDDSACSEEDEERRHAGQVSKGSALHDEEQCKPCLYMNSKLGCMNGAECKFCHLPHQKRRRPRPCKSTRMKCKQIATMLDTFCPASEQSLQVTEELGARSQYMRAILQGKQKQLEAAIRANGAEAGQPGTLASTAGAAAGSSSANSAQLQVSVGNDGGKNMKLLLSL